LIDDSPRTLFYTHSQIGNNAVLQITPPIVHFAGFELGCSHELTVNIVNISSSQQRLHILHPAAKHFSISYNKKAMIAPGMHETLTIKFTPSEYRYHFNEVKLHTSDGNMVVPVHAYPVMNTRQVFPSRITFANSKIGATNTRVVTMTSEIPISFEFDITVLASHQAFTYVP
jgi:hypothetical protein